MIDNLYPIVDDIPSPATQEPLHGRQLGKLLAAAVVSKPFCDLLLRDPGQAISKGYQGESFLLTDYELDLVLSIRAATLQDFACQLDRARVLSREASPILNIVPCDQAPVDFYVEVRQNTGLD